MPEIAHSAHDMIAGMTPARVAGEFVYASVDADKADAALLSASICRFREAEGLSLIVPRDVARVHGLPDLSPMVCITLNVYSSLEGIGLTAAVSNALAANGIACNMVAAHHHDHAFVPATDADRAMAVLQRLQEDASRQ